MKKIYSILISLLITSFILISLNFQKESLLEDTVIIRVIDGDTLVSSDNRTLRLANINSPEKNKFGYSESINFLSRLINKTVKINSLSLDNTGRREVVRLYYDDQYLNLIMVESGLTSKAWVEDSEISDFRTAEDDAIDKERGIWKKSKYFGCLDVSLDKEMEILSIQKVCENLDITNWYLKDESREIYIIKEDFEFGIIKSGNFSIIYKNDSVFYWKEQNIWNNDRDTIYIFDSQNKIVYHFSYGYD